MIFLPRCPICSDKMPEGPELHMASIYVNKMCTGVVFTGAVIKSEVSKSSDVPFTCEAYRITATSRGKEVKLTLTPVKSDEPTRTQKAGQADQPMDIVFRFGMSGFFKFTAEDELPKHAHLRFYSSEKPCRVLSFVDARRFGSWHPSGVWQPSRGPCVLTEYKGFRLAVPKLQRHWFSWLTDITSLTRRCALFSTGRTSFHTCRTTPSTGQSVKFCSIRSTSTGSATTSGLKSFSGDLNKLYLTTHIFSGIKKSNKN